MDFKILFATRSIRLFAYGFLSVVLALYLAKIGLSEWQIGLLFSGTLLGDAGISLWMTTVADRIGRKRMLLLGSGLMLLSGIGFLLTQNPWLLALTAIIGVISPSGNEIGPFLSIEQASLSQVIADKDRTRVFAWYNLAGSFATALGALAGGWLVSGLESAGYPVLAAYRWVIIGYALAGLVLLFLFLALGPKVEVETVKEKPRTFLGLHQSKSVVLKLSALFSLDAFAGGMILQSLLAYWFYTRYGLEAGFIGSLFFGANILAGISALLAVPLAKRIGLIQTMVYTHIPSNILLILVPLMPTVELAIAVMLARFAISQMDVPTRQSYTMAVVAPDERSAAAGVTGIARSLGASLSPSIAGALFGIPALASVPFFLCGGLKILYDLLLYREFSRVKPPEE